MTDGGRQRPGWTFLTHHAQMLLAVARDPDARVRDLALRVGVSPRAAVTLLGDLVDAGYVERRRVGRRNVYAVHADLPFRHPAQADHAVGELVALFAGPDDPSARGRPGGAPAGGADLTVRRSGS